MNEEESGEPANHTRLEIVIVEEGPAVREGEPRRPGLHLPAVRETGLEDHIVGILDPARRVRRGT